MAEATGMALDRSLFRVGERVCVALSGGADSTALLLGMIDLNTETRYNKQPLGAVLSAVHVNHGLRGEEADADEAFVRELCGRLGVPLTVERVDTPARQQAEAEGVEEAARALRYGVFSEILGGQIGTHISSRCGAPGLSIRADVVATAHTLDDQAETVMMKLMRGAWTEGIGGIAPAMTADSGQRTAGKQILRFAQDDKGGGRDDKAGGRDDKAGGRDDKAGGRIVRPMLGVRRAEIEAYLRERGQGWRTDSSNADLSLTRNRVRHELMPLLRSFNPGVDLQLARLAEIARDEEAYWQGELARLLPQLVLPGRPVRGGGRAVATGVGEAGCAVEIERLRTLAPAVRRRVVRAAARGIGARMSAVETAKVLALAGLGAAGEPGGKPGARLELSRGLRVERTVRELQFRVLA